ncbi:amino acid ABC transporter permease [Mycobacterium sp. NPDC048908]|uniref:amino acid ABC transporter permease n=1 Tax=Mycobacterium sp. NPDC048908 TaxID=3364292 RepID=UPI00371792B1
MLYQWRTVLEYLPEFLRGMGLTLWITVLAFALALVCALASALARNSTVAALRLIAGAYVEVVRNTPVLLQIFVVFFAFPSLGVRLDAVTAGVVAIGVNVGAYLSEVFRAGISSVPRAQREAAQVLGLSPRRTFISVIAPQALRNVYPATINNLIQVLLGTSLLTAIAVPELTGVATVVNARTLLFVQVFAIALVLYLVLSNVLSIVAGFIGRALFKPPLEQMRPGLWPIRRGRTAVTEAAV